MTETPFVEQLREIAHDLRLDYRDTFQNLEPEAVRRVQEAVFAAITSTDGNDPEDFVNKMMSLNWWMFMVGREHALRGYPPPIQRSDVPADPYDPKSDLFGVFDLKEIDEL